MTSRLLPPVPPEVVEAALGPMLASELRSLQSELQRHQRQGQALEARVLAVLDRAATRIVELHAREIQGPYRATPGPPGFPVPAGRARRPVKLQVPSEKP